MAFYRGPTIVLDKDSPIEVFRLFFGDQAEAMKESFQERTQLNTGTMAVVAVDHESGAVTVDDACDDEQCGQCGAFVVGHHACQGVPGEEP